MDGLQLVRGDLTLMMRVVPLINSIKINWFQSEMLPWPSPYSPGTVNISDNNAHKLHWTKFKSTNLTNNLYHGWVHLAESLSDTDLRNTNLPLIKHQYLLNAIIILKLSKTHQTHHKTTTYWETNAFPFSHTVIFFWRLEQHLVAICGTAARDTDTKFTHFSFL